MFLVAIYSVTSFFRPKAPAPDKAVAAIEAKAGAEQGAPVSHAKAPEVSDNWRAAGYLVTRTGVRVVVMDGRRMRFLDNPPSYRVSGGEVESFLPSGEAVTSWSGQKAGGVLEGPK